MAVRKPRPPRLTGKSGTSLRPMARAADSSVPSPPNTITRSQPSGTFSRGIASLRPAYWPVGSSKRKPMPRCCSHAISSGTSFSAAPTPGLEMMPTVLISGIEEKLLVPFRPQNGAIDDAGSESELSHGALHPLASCGVHRRIAHDAALAYLTLPRFELGFDQYNQPRLGRAKQRLERRQDERHRDETYVAD